MICDTYGLPSKDEGTGSLLIVKLMGSGIFKSCGVELRPRSAEFSVQGYSVGPYK
jgi:hypothetical protein